MRDKADLVAAAFSGGVETSIHECAHAFGCISDNPLETAELLREQLNSLRLTLTSGAEYNDPRILRASKETDLVAEISQHETSRIEFKETLLFNVKQAENNPETKPEKLAHDPIIHSSLKSIAAFLNKDGGVLYIGVTDAAEIVGIERDYRCRNGVIDSDSWQRFLSELIRTKFKDGKQVANHILIELVHHEGKVVAKISVTARRELSFLLDEKKQCHFFVRSGSETIELQIEDLQSFLEARDRGN